MYKNFIFDLYGTLVDIRTNERKNYLWKKCAVLLTDMGIPYSTKEFHNAYDRYVKEEKARIAGTYEYTEAELANVFRNVLEHRGDGSPSGYPVTDEAIANLALIFRVLSRDFVRCYDEIIPIMEFLKSKGKKIWLLSNAQTLFTIPEIKTCGIYDYFDDIIISSDCGVRKPDRAFMQVLLDKHGLDISESIMVGNDVQCDVGVADSVGMDSFYIHSDLSPELDGTEHATYMDLTTGELKVSHFEKLV